MKHLTAIITCIQDNHNELKIIHSNGETEFECLAKIARIYDFHMDPEMVMEAKDAGLDFRDVVDELSYGDGYDYIHKLYDDDTQEVYIQGAVEITL